MIRPGIVHRIDKDTSGLLVVAKNDFAHASLARQIKEHTFTREYSAVVHGRLKDLPARWMRLLAATPRNASKWL